MKDHTSRIQSVDSEIASDCSREPIGFRGSEGLPWSYKGWVLNRHSRQVKASVEIEILDYGIENLWSVVGANSEIVRVGNPSNAPEHSTSYWTSDFTGRVSVLDVGRTV